MLVLVVKKVKAKIKAKSKSKPVARASSVKPVAKKSKLRGLTVTCICPECGADVVLPAKSLEGSVIPCAECKTDLQVVKRGTKIDVELIDKLEEERETELPLEEDTGGETDFDSE